MISEISESDASNIRNGIFMFFKTVCMLVVRGLLGILLLERNEWGRERTMSGSYREKVSLLYSNLLFPSIATEESLSDDAYNI